MTRSQNPPSSPDQKKTKTIMWDRDWWALRIIAEQTAIRLDHLGQLFALWPPPGYQPPPRVPLKKGTDEIPTPKQTFAWPQDPVLQRDAARRIARRWERPNVELINSQRTEKFQPIWIIPTTRLMQELNLPYDARRAPGHDQRRHLYEIMKIRMLMMRHRAHDRWISEREIRAGYDEKAKGQELPHTPDALLVTTDGQRIAIEVELTRKSEQRLDAILEELAQSYDATWYFVSPEARAAVLMSQNHLDQEEQKKITLYQL